MESVRNEGLATVNDIPQAISCLIMPGTGEQMWRPSHYHAYIELLYVLKGSSELRVNSRVVRLPCAPICPSFSYGWPAIGTRRPVNLCSLFPERVPHWPCPPPKTT